MGTTTTSAAGLTGEELRAARSRTGMTRAQVARLAGCSLAMLGNLEAGAIPQRSAVLARVTAVLENTKRQAEEPGASHKTGMAVPEHEGYPS